jgi:K+-sensing histidine kinase KdpD
MSPPGTVRETGPEGDILVAVSGRPGDADIIDFAKRLADRNRGRWHAVHVETAGRSDRSDPAMVAESLGLAATMGASVATIPAATVADGLIRHLANSFASHLVIGRGDQTERRWRRRDGTLDALLGRRFAAVVHLVPVEPSNIVLARSNNPVPAALLDYGIAAAFVVLTLAVAVVLNQAAGVRSLSLLFLLPVIAAAARLSLKPALLAALLSVGVYNIFFLDPAYVFKPQAVQSLVMAVVLLVVAFYTSAITSTLRGRVALSDRSAQENASLASFARQLTQVSDWKTTAEAICNQVSAMLVVQTVLLRDVDGSLVVVASSPPGACLQPLDQAALDWTWSSSEEAGSGTSVLSAADWQFQPLKTSLGTLAVLGLARDDGRSPVAPQRKVLLSTLIAQAALAHERLLLESRMNANSRDNGMRIDG